MHKLYDVMDRVETLDGVDARIGNEYSQINYLLQRLDGCLVVDALGAVSSSLMALIAAPGRYQNEDREAAR